MKSAAHHQGLSEQQVLENRTRYGINILTPPEKEPLWKQFLEKFSDPIIKILLVALLLSVGVAFYQFFTGTEPASVFLEPAGILAAILLATCVGFAFEVSANKKFEILNQVNDDTMVQVIRGGNICELPRRDVVVGDIVILNTGEEVPADGVLLEAVSLQVNESTLTGEPLIGKTTDEEEFKKDATYPSNHVLKGTTVADGHGVMEVTSVGDRTEYGKVYEGSQIDNKVQTPLNRQLSRLGDLITWASYAIAAFIVIGRLTLYFSHLPGPVEWLSAGTYILNTVMIAVTVIVVTVPEGLPMSVTLSLALSMKSMLANNNLVRKMHACETMGAATVICTDKTGTLTRNQMNVYKADFYGLGDAAPAENELGNLIREGIAVNSTAFLDYADPEHIRALGNPTEGALLLWLHGLGVNYLDLRENARVLEQLTFSTERKYMATVAESPLLGKKVLYVKGAPEIVLGLCSTVLTPEGQVPAADMRPAIEEQLLAYQNQAMRTLGFAYRVLEDDAPVFEDGRIIRKDLVYLGIAAISDPVRDDVPQAVKDCMDAGIRIKIVTGDTPGTAREIGRQIGLWTEEDTPDRLMTGVEFEQTPDAELLDRVMDLKIMCRARPMDKERLVKLLQKKDQVVAVTGDGTNDAPALKQADIGVAMGITGTEVAKDAAGMVLTDDNFATIVDAVREGRGIYSNIRKVVGFLLGTNIGEVMTVFTAMLLWHKTPLLSMQLLWINLVTDSLPAIALGMEAVESDIMQHKPKSKDEGLFAHGLGLRVVLQGMMFALLTLSSFWMGQNMVGTLAAGQTMAFITLSISQLVQSYNMRSERSLFHIGPFSNKKLNQACLVSLALVLLVLFTPLRIAFGLAALPAKMYLIAFGISFIPLLVMEFSKKFGLIKHQH